LDKERLAILIPTYNRASRLGLCLEALCNQKDTNFDIYISDNDSSDDTAKKIQSFADRLSIILIRQGTNIGLVGNHNSLLVISKGKWCCFMSDDDTVDPHFVKEARRFTGDKKQLIFSTVEEEDERSGGVVVWNKAYEGETLAPETMLRKSFPWSANDKKDDLIKSAGIGGIWFYNRGGNFLPDYLGGFFSDTAFYLGMNARSIRFQSASYYRKIWAGSASGAAKSAMYRTARIQFFKDVIRGSFMRRVGGDAAGATTRTSQIHQTIYLGLWLSREILVDLAIGAARHIRSSWNIGRK